MAVRDVVRTVLTSAVVSASNPCVKAFTVFLLALAFLTSAALMMFFPSSQTLDLHYFPRFFYAVQVLVIVGAAVAYAVRRAHFSS